ncbi:MAG: hypothetical protein ACLQBA_16045 [Candidatus Binataceae bacterium]
MTKPIDHIDRKRKLLDAAAIEPALLTIALAILLFVIPREVVADSTGSDSLFLDGHFAVVAGMTYQYDGSKGTTLGVATWSYRVWSIDVIDGRC